MSKRTELAKKIPWVKYLKDSQKCNGYRSGRPLKAIFSSMPNYDPKLNEKFECKLPAHWKFRALKKSYAEDGIYCWSHLMHRGLYGDMDEEARTERWLEKHASE